MRPTMTDPTTEAGRALLSGPAMKRAFLSDVLAIEREAWLAGAEAGMGPALAEARAAGRKEERARLADAALAAMEAAAHEGRVAHLFEFMDILDAPAEEDHCDRIVNNGEGEPTECGRRLPCEYHDAPEEAIDHAVGARPGQRVPLGTTGAPAPTAADAPAEEE